MPQRNLLIIFFTALFSLACYAQAERSRYASALAEAMRLIDENYLEPVDSYTLFEGAMTGMVDSLDDQYSAFISARDYVEFQQSLDQQFGGVGIVVEMDPESNRLTVMTPLVNTPAYEAGMQAGDVIIKIEDESTREMTMSNAVALMRGEPGTDVRLTVRRGGQKELLEFRLTRAVIPIESVLGDVRRPDGSWKFHLEEQPRIGYIRITTFGDQTASELRKALEQYEEHPIDALVLDVRDNAGGYLSAAVAVCDMFIDEGVIVTTRKRDGQVRAAYKADPQNTVFPQETPIAVLVNQFSASASEIVGACLQDHRRAAVVGERTWGKGTVQNIIPLENGQVALKLTTASYWRPSGANIHRVEDAEENGDWGVRPDEGLRVSLAQEVADKLRRLRRQRDVIHRPGEKSETAEKDPPVERIEPEEENPDLEEPPPEPADAPDVKDPATIEQWSDDPQLRRAIEYLQEQLQSQQKGDSQAA